VDKTVGVQESHYETLLRRFLVTTTDDYAPPICTFLGYRPQKIDFTSPQKFRGCVLTSRWSVVFWLSRWKRDSIKYGVRSMYIWGLQIGLNFVPATKTETRNDGSCDFCRHEIEFFCGQM
jgi:hypothetical protein